MYLIQLLLPLYSNVREPLPKKLYVQVRNELVERFGGLTAYMRAPASGLWQEGKKRTVYDDLVIYEVMTETLDEKWWHEYRAELEVRFQQKTLVVRAQETRIL